MSCHAEGQTETKCQSYAQKFEDGGLRLLKKSQKGVIHAIFSRFGLVLLLLLLQVGLLVSIFRWFGNLLPTTSAASVVVTAAMVLYLLNSKMDNSAKITWMVVIALFPVVGVPLFFYVKSNVATTSCANGCWNWKMCCAPSCRKTDRSSGSWKRPNPARRRWRPICTDGAAASRCMKTPP